MAVVTTAAPSNCCSRDGKWNGMVVDPFFIIINSITTPHQRDAGDAGTSLAGAVACMGTAPVAVVAPVGVGWSVVEGRVEPAGAPMVLRLASTGVSADWG